MAFVGLAILAKPGEPRFGLGDRLRGVEVDVFCFGEFDLVVSGVGVEGEFLDFGEVV